MQFAHFGKSGRKGGPLLYPLLPLPRNEQLDKKKLFPFFLYLYILLYYYNNKASGPFATQTAGTLSGSQRLKRAVALYFLAMPAVRL